MTNILDLRNEYREKKKVYASEKLEFSGVGGRDVYNCSVPFEFDGKTYIFGRVERREEWASSTTHLFCKNEENVWQKVISFDPLPLEDPYVVKIHDEYVVAGTHVVKEKGTVKTYCCYFYRGKDLFSLRYWTTGPDYMKDIRLAELQNGKVCVFSRPRNEDILKEYGCESQVGAILIDSLDELCADVICKANYIKGMFNEGEWGGLNQAFVLEKELVGAIGHQCYTNDKNCAVYVNTAYVIDLSKNKVVLKKVIGEREDYPKSASKITQLSDCAFTSGLVYRPDGKADLYSGLSDVGEGKIVIDDPFSGIKKFTEKHGERIA